MDSLENLGAALMAMLAVFVVFFLIVVAFNVICRWKLFTKAGRPGWYALIPIYSDYKLYDTVWEGKFFFINIGISFLFGLIASIAGITISGIVSNGESSATFGAALEVMMTSLLSIVSFVLMIFFYINLCKAYSHEVVLIIGLIFMPVIFLPYIAFSSSSIYVGNSKQRKMNAQQMNNGYNQYNNGYNQYNDNYSQQYNNGYNEYNQYSNGYNQYNGGYNQQYNNEYTDENYNNQNDVQ
ncbi:MAG: hypothetical protein IJ593_05945 [Lachnospiraceae bacterium]|nr:hypothetical protein [Lachnospiraceae bacterium]